MNTKKQTTIFIVDDNKIFALALKAYIENAFENMFLKIHSFETGEKCMKIFKQVVPDLVILDYCLNSVSASAADGLQVLSEIKKLSSETSVIMLTSNDQIDIAVESFHHGASDYLVKRGRPFKKINYSISKIFAKKELDFQKKEKRTAEGIFAINELAFQKEEREKSASELIIANFQRSEVEKSKLAIEKKNKDITDSINYAKRIQLAKLPRREEIYASFPNSFVLFKPKDIVSGDFYFFHRNDHSFVIAAADCTGHGVPGAFMSMICSGKLEEAVALTSDTSEILKYLNKGVKKSLHQSDSDESTRDGMDIAICSVDTKKRIVKYAGANRPIWIIRNGQTTIEEIKGTKKTIGGYTEDNQYFDSHELKLQEGDTFYITTDGYADQFGGPVGKKLMAKKFKEILLRIQILAMKEQKKYLNNYIENWKAETEQVDDILVIGVRL